MVLVIVFLSFQAHAQETLLTIGSHFPDIVITDISNAPVEEFCPNKEKSNKFYILNFLGHLVQSLHL